MTRFSRVDRQGAGLKEELRLTRELSLGGETRLYFGNGELIERETVVVGEQGREKFCCEARDRSQKTTWLPPQVQHRHYHPHTLPLTTDPKQMSKQFQFKLVLLGVHTSRTFWQFLTLALQESPQLASLGTPHPSATPACPRNSSVFSLVLRFVKDQFDDYRESTIGGEDCSSCRTTPSLTNIDPPQPHS